MPLQRHPLAISVMLFLAFLLPLALAVPSLHSITRSSTCPVILPPDRPPAVSRLATTPKIIGGDASTSSSGLFTLAVRSPITPESTRRLCTAARLSTDWGITAAHCALNTNWTAELPDGRIAAITEVHVHEKYLSVIDRIYDIAVFRMKAASDAERVVRINIGDERPLPGAFVRVLGVGAVTTDSRVGSTPLNQVDIPVVPFDKCETAYKDVANTGAMSSDAQICAGYMDSGGCDSCVGDSGGPVVQFNSERKPVLVALVSAGRGCALPGFPGINLRVNKYVDWMKTKGAIFDVDDAPVQLVLDGGYPAKPPSEAPKPPKPAAQPSKGPASAPPPPPPPVETPAVEPPPQETSEPARPPSTPTRTPTPNRTPAATVAVQSPEEDSSSVEPASVPAPVSSEEFPTVQAPSPSPFGSATAPTKTPDRTPDITPVEDTAVPTQPPQAEEGGNGQEPVLAANGAGGEAPAKAQTASTGGDAKTAGIVAGSIAGLIVVAGFIVLAIKVR